MALQHTRAVVWQAEDLGFGGQRSLRRVFTATVQGTTPLYVATPAFIGSTTVPQQLLGSSYSSAVAGFNRLVINRSPRFFMTLTCTLQDTGTKQIQFVLYPRQMIFLPTNCIGTSATLVADTNYLLQLPAGVPISAIPRAGNTTALSFDFVREA